MGRVSIICSYSFRCLTTETVKSINENCFIENLAASKYSMWHREGNKCNNKQYRLFTFCMFRSSELACVQERKQVCVSITQCKEREVTGTLHFFMCLIDMDKFFEKHLLPLKHV